MLIYVFFMYVSLHRPNEGFLRGVRAFTYCKNQWICAKMNTQADQADQADLLDLPDLPEMVSATAARSLPSTRAGGQDYKLPQIKNKHQNTNVPAPGSGRQLRFSQIKTTAVEISV